MLKSFINKNKPILILLSLALVVGVSAGVLFSSLLPIDQKASLYDSIQSACNSEIKSEFVNFLRSLLINIRFWLLIFIAGLNIKLKFSAGVSVFIKGYFIGFALGSTTLNFGFNGFLFSFATVLPQVFTIVPVMFLFSCQALTNKKYKPNNKKEPMFSKDWFLISAIFGMLFIICSFIDGYIIPVFLNAIGKLIV